MQKFKLQKAVCVLETGVLQSPLADNPKLQEMMFSRHKGTLISSGRAKPDIMCCRDVLIDTSVFAHDFSGL